MNEFSSAMDNVKSTMNEAKEKLINWFSLFYYIFSLHLINLPHGPESGLQIITAIISVNGVANTPSVTHTTTDEDKQSISGLVISRHIDDGAEVTHVKITNITNGRLYKHDGTTEINNDDFISLIEGNSI